MYKYSLKNIIGLTKNNIDKIGIIDIMVTIRAIYYINVLKESTLEAGGLCKREYYPCW